MAGPPGERNGMHKLTDTQVKTARRWRKRYRYPWDYLAFKTGVDSSTIRKACRRQTWKHLS